jgi:hypothetical protein
MANQQEWTARKANENIRPTKLKDASEDLGLEQKKFKKNKMYNHEWCNISLIDIHSFNFIKAPFYGCRCIMHMFINKTETAMRMVGVGYWLGIFNTSSPGNKGGISV